MRWWLVLTLWLAALAPTWAAKPNVVFLLADDLRYNALGCMGDPIVKSPAIDSLATEGLLFRNHFVTTSICSVSRASILTGQYARRHGIITFNAPLTAEQWTASYPAQLKQAGYRIGFIGKWGVGDKPDQVAAAGKNFDFWRGVPGQGGGLFIDPNDPKRKHTTARMGDEALEFLSGCKADEPFCLSVSFNSPHARDGKPREFQPDDRDEKLYADVTIPTPRTGADEYFDRLPESVRKSIGRTRWALRFDTPEKFQATMRDYYRLVSGLDREVGRIREALKSAKMADNTVIVFTSDNGFFFGEHGLADKWYAYEESIRVPLIVCDPRLPKERRGQSVPAMTLNIDLGPTLLDLVGVMAPKVMQGRSLVPLCQGKPPTDWRTEFFYEHHSVPDKIAPSEGIRTMRYSYIRWVAEKPVKEELYDIEADPFQERNLAGEEKHGETLKLLREKWERAGPGLK